MGLPTFGAALGCRPPEPQGSQPYGLPDRPAPDMPRTRTHVSPLTQSDYLGAGISSQLSTLAPYTAAVQPDQVSNPELALLFILVPAFSFCRLRVLNVSTFLMSTPSSAGCSDLPAAAHHCERPHFWRLPGTHVSCILVLPAPCHLPS